MSDRFLLSVYVTVGLLIAVVAGAGTLFVYDEVVIDAPDVADSQIVQYRQSLENQIDTILVDYSGRLQRIKTSGRVNLASVPLNFFDGSTGDSIFDTNVSSVGTIFWTNNQRSSVGLSSLRESSRLNQIAQAKLEDMFSRGYFEHIAPNGEDISDVAARYGYSYASIGENLALGLFEDDIELVNAWMASPGHRANILNQSYREIGVASRVGSFAGQPVLISVQVFAKPLSVCTAPNQVLKSQILANQAKLEELEQALALNKDKLESWTSSSLPADHDQLIEQYNRQVKDFNNLIKVTEASVSAYNSEVNEYNYCLSN